jgi:short-subunit dehydrogenase
VTSGVRPTALITGATGGLGLEIATMLATQGYQMILVDFDGVRLEAMAANFDGAVTYVLDQRGTAAVSAFCDQFIEIGGPIDVAIVNAGIVSIGHLTDISREAMLDQLQINLVSSAAIIQSLARRMVRQGNGHILATVSMGGIVSIKGSAAYSASKFGLRGLLWALRDELKLLGVDVTGIYPAGVDTPMLRHEALHGGSALNFVGQPVSPAQVAEAIRRALKAPKLEVYVPYSESISSRIFSIWPGLLSRLYPVLEYMGEKGRSRFIASQRVVGFGND